MARRKKKEDTTLVPGEKQEPAIPNRYGAQGIDNEDHEPCCCHRVALCDPCTGCDALKETKRQPTLVGVEEDFAEDDDRQYDDELESYEEEEE